MIVPLSPVANSQYVTIVVTSVIEADGRQRFFPFAGRCLVGSSFTDTSSGTPEAAVLAAPGNLLNPDNDENLGRTTVGLVSTPPDASMLDASLTLTASAATPLGTYTIAPTAGISFASDDAFNDYDMSTGTPFTIVVGQTLTVNKTGDGSGTVTADSGPINCGATCSGVYPGTIVTLTATPAVGSTFAGWSGSGCSGTGTCVVTVDAAKSVTAQFDIFVAPTFALNVTKVGTGTGTVTSAPAGINCGSTCAVGYPNGTVVTLTAAPGTGQNFTGWSGGGCSGTGTCVVTLTAATTVTATFTDTTPPDTTILSGPSNPSNDPNPTFTFESSEPGATFQCSLNGAAFTACTSPRTVTVNNGEQLFSVQAVDAAGNVDPTPATYAWTAAGIIAVVVQPIPTLSEWALILLSLMMASLGLVAYRRRM